LDSDVSACAPRNRGVYAEKPEMGVES
jgi:hypothetical protein